MHHNINDAGQNVLLLDRHLLLHIFASAPFLDVQLNLSQHVRSVFLEMFDDVLFGVAIRQFLETFGSFFEEGRFVAEVHYFRSGVEVFEIEGASEGRAVQLETGSDDLFDDAGPIPIACYNLYSCKTVKSIFYGHLLLHQSLQTVLEQQVAHLRYHFPHCVVEQFDVLKVAEFPAPKNMVPKKLEPVQKGVLLPLMHNLLLCLQVIFTEQTR